MIDNGSKLVGGEKVDMERGGGVQFKVMFYLNDKSIRWRVNF